MNTSQFFNSNYECIIIGAGITGLVAARDLAKKRVKVLLVEATDRLGGRIYEDCETFRSSNTSAEPSSEKKDQDFRSFSPFCLSLGAHKVYPSNHELLIAELKRYKLQLREQKYSKTFVQIQDHHIISLFELFQRIQSNPCYQAIVKDLNNLSILIDPLHAPFDYDQTGEYYNRFEEQPSSSSAIPSSASIAAQEKYYEQFGKNILQSDLYHQYDISFIDYLEQHSAFTSGAVPPQTMLEQQFLADKTLVIEFFQLTVILLFEIESREVSLLMLLNLINLFHFKFENILSFTFHSYHTIDHSEGFYALLDGIFQEFIDHGGQYLFNTAVVSVYQNIHYYQASVKNYYEGSANTYNVQNTPYYPQTRPSTTLANNSSLPIPPITPSTLQPVRVKTAYPITNTFLQLPADITNAICKLTNGEIYQTKQIILTVPINCLSSIQFFPNLSVIFQRAVERCYPNTSNNLLQVYGICSNHVRDGQQLPETITNKSNISNRIDRILALPSARSVQLGNDVYQSIVHHRELYFSEIETEGVGENRQEDVTLVSVQGIRRSIVERKQESFELMHPDIEKLSKRSMLCHDFTVDPFLRTHWFHLRQGTRNLYTRLCIEAISPWKYCKQNTLTEEGNQVRNENEEVETEIDHVGTLPVVKNDLMSLYITNADLSPVWTGWMEGGIYMGKKAAEILYPRIIQQPILTNFAKKNL